MPQASGLLLTSWEVVGDAEPNVREGAQRRSSVHTKLTVFVIICIYLYNNKDICIFRYGKAFQPK